MLYIYLIMYSPLQYELYQRTLRGHQGHTEGLHVQQGCLGDATSRGSRAIPKPGPTASRGPWLDYWPVVSRGPWLDFWPVASRGPVHSGCSRGWSHSSTATTGRPEIPPEGGGGDRKEGAREVEEAGVRETGVGEAEERDAGVVEAGIGKARVKDGGIRGTGAEEAGAGGAAEGGAR